MEGAAVTTALELPASPAHMSDKEQNWWEVEAWWLESGYDDAVERREALYRSGATTFPHLPLLAELWMRELEQTRLTDLDRSSAASRKQAEAYEPYRDPWGGEEHPVRLESGKAIWVRLDGYRTDRGYRKITVSDEILRTDAAIIAALTALEASEIKTFELDRLVKILRRHLDARLRGSISESVADTISKLQNDTTQSRDVTFLKGLDLRSLEFALTLLRERRAGFDDLPSHDQLALLKRTFTYINEIVANVSKLMRFLEYGKPSGLPTRTLETAGKRVQAAILRDVVGLSPPRVAEEMGIPEPSDFDNTRDVPEARDLADYGRALLEKALGKDGWKQQVEKMKADMNWWQSLTGEQQRAEKWADQLERSFGPGPLVEGVRRRAYGEVPPDDEPWPDERNE